MSDSESSEARGARTAGRGRIALIVGMLFLVTLAGAQAARIGAGPADPQPIDPNGLIRQTVDGPLSFEGRLDRGAVRVGHGDEVHLELTARAAERPARSRSGSPGGRVQVHEPGRAAPPPLRRPSDPLPDMPPPDRVFFPPFSV